MFYKIKVKDHIRLPPDKFAEDLETGMLSRIKEKFNGFISKDLGIVIDVTKIDSIQDGIIIAGDGAPYYEVDFDLLAFKPILQEIVFGKIKDITDFGAFINIGPTEGMIHISQTMNDFVSFSKEKVLQGKESNRTLKVGDLCRARVIAISYKDVTNPKLGLTMRQPRLGKLEWLDEDNKKPKAKPEGKAKAK